MQKIQEILERRSAPFYYEDCINGSRIAHQRDMIAHQVEKQLEAMDSTQLRTALRKLTDGRDMRLVFQKYEVSNTSPLELTDLYYLVYSILIEKKMNLYAAEIGCDQFGECILCPVGRDLVAREIFDYAMGPSIK